MFACSDECGLYEIWGENWVESAADLSDAASVVVEVPSPPERPLCLVLCHPELASPHMTSLSSSAERAGAWLFAPSNANARAPSRIGVHPLAADPIPEPGWPRSVCSEVTWKTTADHANRPPRRGRVARPSPAAPSRAPTHANIGRASHPAPATRPPQRRAAKHMQRSAGLTFSPPSGLPLKPLKQESAPAKTNPPSPIGQFSRSSVGWTSTTKNLKPQNNSPRNRR